MRRFLLDTGIAGDYIGKRNGVFDRARAARARGFVLGMAYPVLGELVYGIEYSQSRDRNMQRLQTALPAFRLWPFDKAAAFEYGRLRAYLIRTGRPMQSNDIMTAAVALTLGNCTVVTKDTDFDAIPGLKVENWAIQLP